MVYYFYLKDNIIFIAKEKITDVSYTLVSSEYCYTDKAARHRAKKLVILKNAINCEIYG